MSDSAAESPPATHTISSISGRITAEVLAGLRRGEKQLPCKLFYDDRGSRLFNQISELEEYYLTRTEVAILRGNIRSIASMIGPGCLLMEYGSGSNEKSSILLDNLPRLAGYVPIDISRQCLESHVRRVKAAYPHLDVFPVCADYTGPFSIPRPRRRVRKRVVFFPGSTIGNFHPPDAVKFLRRIGQECGSRGGLLIGVDLVKDPRILNLAYNDSRGVTAEFNLNVLRRINRELGADFDLRRFRHLAFYNHEMNRMEMHLVSLEDQVVHLNGQEIRFRKGERIWTESSYKYTVQGFASLALEAGFAVERVWTDENNLFSVHYLAPRPSGPG